VFTAAAQEAPKPQFTARELFYSASDSPAKPAATPAKPANPAPPPKTSTAAVKKPPQTQPVQPPTSTTATVIKPAEPVVTAPGTQPAQQTATVVKAAMVTAPAPVNGTPLGLKYTILKKQGDDMVEVAPDTPFHAGDRVQLSVQTNGPGYLYVILKGTSGTWA